MPDVMVREIDASALARLQERAVANGRSLDSELKVILEQAAGQTVTASAKTLAEQMTLRLAGRTHTDSATLLREDRSR